MVNLELSHAHYSVLLQALLSRMDYLTSKIHFYTESNNWDMVTILKDDFSDVFELYIRLKTTQLMKKIVRFRQYLRCVIVYTDIQSVRVLHYAVSTDYVEDFTQMIKDTFVHPDISFIDIIYSPDSRQFFQLIQI